MGSTRDVASPDTDIDQPSFTASSSRRSPSASSNGETSATSLSSHSGAHNGIEGMTTQPGDEEDVPRRNLSRWQVDLEEIRSGSMRTMFERLSTSSQMETTESRKGDSAIRKVAELIKSGRAKKIVLLSGAGMSTSAGIPDFRSDTGLYNNMRGEKLKGLKDPQDVFTLDFFTGNPIPFWTVAQDIYPGKHFPTPAHYFVALLAKKNLLEKIFTQNIDTLEQLTGMDPSLIVEAHGSFATAHCLTCGKPASTEHVLKSGVRQGEVVRCSAPRCNGLVKPDIVFFGEGLPMKFHTSLPSLPQCDLCIVIGTSLLVQPFANLPGYVRAHIPRLLINREPVGPFVKLGEPQSREDMISRFLAGVSITDEASRPGDLYYQGDADDGLRKLAEEIGWADELNEMIEDGNRKLQKKWDERADLEGPPLAQIETIEEPLGNKSSRQTSKDSPSKVLGVAPENDHDTQTATTDEDPSKVPMDEIRDFSRLIKGAMKNSPRDSDQAREESPVR